MIMNLGLLNYIHSALLIWFEKICSLEIPVMSVHMHRIFTKLYQDVRAVLSCLLG